MARARITSLNVYNFETPEIKSQNIVYIQNRIYMSRCDNKCVRWYLNIFKE